MTSVVAYAVTRDDEPRVFVAEDEFVLTRVIALELVAATAACRLSRGGVSTIRRALLNEEWDVAVSTWIAETGIAVDVYPPEIKVWTNEMLDAERTSLELRMTPIFDDAGAAGDSGDSDHGLGPND